MSYTLYENDIPSDLHVDSTLAIDTETMGLKPDRDRLCLVQLSTGDGHAHLVQLFDYSKARNLKALISNPDITKLFHFARFDIAVLKKYLQVECTPVFCTKIASKLCRTYTDRHGLKHLCQDMLDIELSKEKQSSDWGARELSHEQLQYAANDVLYLHQIQEKLIYMLEREERADMAQACFDFLPSRAELDLSGWGEGDIFAHR